MNESTGPNAVLVAAADKLERARGDLLVAVGAVIDAEGALRSARTRHRNAQGYYGTCVDQYNEALAAATPIPKEPA